MSTRATMIDPERQMLGEVEMVGQDRWEEIHRRAGAGASSRAIARELDVDRKTVRRCLRQPEWKPYQRAARVDTLLATHAAYLRRRAADVGYSAQVLFQELRGRQYAGSDETVKRFVRPLREMQVDAAVTRTRFETPPGLQRQIDWGHARVWLGAPRQVRPIFVLTLGDSRRSVYVPCLKRFSDSPCTAWARRGTSACTNAGGPMQAYSMDLRERALLDSDAGMKAADVAVKYRVSGSWVRLLKQRRRETGEVAPRVQRHGRRRMLEPHLHTLAALIAEQPDRTLAELKDALGTPASLATIWRAVAALDVTVKKNGPALRTRST